MKGVTFSKLLESISKKGRPYGRFFFNCPGDKIHYLALIFDPTLLERAKKEITQPGIGVSVDYYKFDPSRDPSLVNLHLRSYKLEVENISPEAKTAHLQGVIEKLLDENPALRDNDRRLLANVYKIWLKTKDKEKISALEFLKLIASGEVPHSETIRRSRQKLQQAQPRLRGERYQERQDLGEEVRQDISRAEGKPFEQLFLT